MKAIALLAWVALASACSTMPEKQPSPDHWLFSWPMRDGSYRFAIIRAAERNAFLNGFQRSFPGQGNMAQVTAQLRALPAHAVVGWGDATCFGFIYPPKDVMRPIERFAFDRGISLLVLPGQCHPD